MIDVIREIVSCDDADCDDNSTNLHKIAERKHLFGGHFCSVQDEENIYKKLMADLYTKERDLQYPATGLRIETIKGLSETSSLGKRFSSFKIIASKYILHVIVTDVMAMTLCVKKGFPNKAANKVCRHVDVIGESISTRLWEEKYEVIDVLHEIVSCYDVDCDDEQHKRHHSFMKDPPLYIK